MTLAAPRVPVLGPNAGACAAGGRAAAHPRHLRSSSRRGRRARAAPAGGRTRARRARDRGRRARDRSPDRRRRVPARRRAHEDLGRRRAALPARGPGGRRRGHCTRPRRPRAGTPGPHASRPSGGVRRGRPHGTTTCRAWPRWRSNPVCTRPHRSPAGSKDARATRRSGTATPAQSPPSRASSPSPSGDGSASPGAGVDRLVVRASRLPDRLQGPRRHARPVVREPLRPLTRRSHRDRSVRSSPARPYRRPAALDRPARMGPRSSRASAGTRLDEAGLRGDDHRPDAVPDTELEEHASAGLAHAASGPAR